jgi:hypothetical protein
MNNEKPSREDLLVMNAIHRYWLQGKGLLCMIAVVYSLFLLSHSPWFILMTVFGGWICWNALHDLEANRELREQILSIEDSG